MQKVKIQNEAVRRNIALFQQIVRHSVAKQAAYRAYVNLKTGSLRFSEASGEEWKVVTLHLDLEAHKIEVFEADPRIQGEFDRTRFLPAAYRIFSETVHALQQLLRIIRTFHEMAEVEIEPPSRSSEVRDFIHEAWHQVDRMGAEFLLLKRSPGTYLFRKDEYAAILEQELTEALHTPVKCVTLSYVDDKPSVHDQTVVLHEQRWMFYDDDPSLGGSHYETISDLLEALGSRLSKPLLHG